MGGLIPSSCWRTASSTRAPAIAPCPKSPNGSPAYTGRGRGSSAWSDRQATIGKCSCPFRPAGALMRKAESGKVSHSVRRARCAVYTRKSSEEGLEQDFNSLDAQREACEAFVRSQSQEGWVYLPQRYD